MTRDRQNPVTSIPVGRTWRCLAWLALFAVCVMPLSGCGGQSRTVKPIAVVAPPGAPLGSVRNGPAAVSWPNLTAVATRATQKLTLSLLPENVDAAGNAVISPYSIEQALAQLALGARGQTATQIARVLTANSVPQISGSSSFLGEYLGRTTSQSSVQSEPQLSNANSIWIASGLAVRPSYLRDADSMIGTLVQRVDFASAPDAASDKINQWVATQTRGHIKQLFGPGAISSDTLLTLVNAIYLNAHWAAPFDPSKTAQASFQTASGTTTKPEFMSLEEPTSFKLARTAGYTAVDLPYTGGNLSMLVVMPTHSTLARFEAGLTPKRLTALATDLKSKVIWLRLPRFNLVLNTSLNSQLENLGMIDAFSPDGADFSGIASQSMSVGTVQHAATLNVFEAGTVATAATGITIEDSAALGGQVETISFNRPFLALIRDRLTGAILFAATVGDPTAS